MPWKSHLVTQTNINEDGLEIEENIEIFYDSEGFAVTSDPEFLFKMGKLCAESGRYLEEGLLCLDDFLNILNFNTVVENESTRWIKALSIFYVGLIFFKIKDEESCEKYFSLIRNELYEL